MQLTKRRNFSNKNKRKIPKRKLSSNRPPPSLNLFQSTPRSLISSLTCRDPKESGKNNSEMDTILIVGQELAESNSFVIQRTPQKGRGRLWKCRKREG